MYQSEVDKFIVFKIANYLLALPINEVLKVVDCSSTISRDGLESMGVVQLGKHMIRVLDLHQQLGARQPLTSTNSLPRATNRPFLVITRDAKGELCGIFAEEPPNLMELPQDLIQSLPKSERKSNGFEMVSHAAVIPQERGTATIFLLDVKQAGMTHSNMLASTRGNF